MSTLADAAFGRDPGRWPLPSARTAKEHWQRAVAAGGQGRYAAAVAELESIGRAGGAGEVQSLALSTQASFLRQLGCHDAARAWDGRAHAIADSHADALADAVIGLAADALGTGRFALSSRLLSEARDVVDGAASGRMPVRFAWVSAELAMVTGRGPAAVGHAERAVEFTAVLGSVRHAVKSDVVLAAALCSASFTERARLVADTALEVARRHGLVPLTWALTCLLGDIGSASHTTDAIDDLRAACTRVVADRGGTWSNG
jgi:hypothetical protein